MVGSARSVADWPTPLRDDGDAPVAVSAAATAGAAKARIR
jgi:hypothetical protein